MINEANLTILNKKRKFKLFKYDFKPITSKSLRIKATRLTRQPCKNVSNLVRRLRVTLKKRQTAFMSLEDYHDDILNM